MRSFTSLIIPSKVARVRRRVWCRILFALACVSCIIAGIGVGYGDRVHNFKGDVISAGNVTDNFRTIFLTATLISVDPLASTMVMDWYINDDNCNAEECTPVNIYFDNNLLQHSDDDSKVNLTNQAQEDPIIFQWYPNEQNEAYFQSGVFRTTSLLFNDRNRRNKNVDSTLQDYPFDVYYAEVFVYGNETANNLEVNLNVDFTEGIAVGFKPSSNVTGSEFYYLNTITLQRNSLVRAYVLTIVIGVWLITFTFVGSAMKIMFRYKQPRKIFAIPIATLFAFTSLRGTMPGAPAGFGAIIDFVGLLPCLAIITIVSVALLAYIVITEEKGGEDGEKRGCVAPPPLDFGANRLYADQETAVEPEKTGKSARYYMRKETGSGSVNAFPENVYEPLQLQDRS